MNFHRKKCVLFDLDGTLVSTGGAGLRALERAFQSLYGVPGCMRDIDPAGKTDPAIIREIFSKCLGRDCSPQEMLAVQEGYLGLLGDECLRAEDYVVMKGIPGILAELRRRDVLVGLGTGNLEKGARIKLERSQLNPFLPFGGFGSDHEDRAELLKVGRARAESFLGRTLDPEDLIVVGDTERDILAARRARFKVVAVATGNTPEEVLRDHAPDFFIPNFEDERHFIEIVCG